MDENEALTPPPSTNQDEYSDLDSQNSQTERRKYQRGGRKKGTGRASHIPPIPQDPLMPPEDYEDPPEVNHSDAGPELLQREPEKDEPHNERPEICPNCSAKSRTPSAESLRPSEEIPKPFQTGIRAFNMKRAAGSSGRPIGVRATSGKEKKRNSKEKRRSKKSRRAESSEEEEMETDGSEEGDGEKKQKPMSIRLDLNLVIEIFLKAKIQGDVTITFL